jgi:hypothetical protein
MFTYAVVLLVPPIITSHMRPNQTLATNLGQPVTAAGVFGHSRQVDSRATKEVSTRCFAREVV